MYISTTISTEGTIKAWRVYGDQDSIWFGVRGMGSSINSVTFAEAQRLVAELQRELAAVEAVARAVAA